MVSCHFCVLCVHDQLHLSHFPQNHRCNNKSETPKLGCWVGDGYNDSDGVGDMTAKKKMEVVMIVMVVVMVVPCFEGVACEPTQLYRSHVLFPFVTTVCKKKHYSINTISTTIT